MESQAKIRHVQKTTGKQHSKSKETTTIVPLQQLFLELEHMASRPFAGLVVELENEVVADDERLQEPFIPPKHNNPTPIALEPCNTGKAAVLSLIVRLPTGGTGQVPPGQTGLAIASALVSLGSMDKGKEGETSSANKNSNISTKCVSPSAPPPTAL